jgi:transposase
MEPGKQLTTHRSNQEQQRLAAARMFEQGARQAEVVAALGVSRGAVSKWHAAWEVGGAQALAARRNPGRPPKLAETQRQTLEQELLRGPQAHGYTTELWTLARIRRLIHDLFGVWYHEAHVWRLLGGLGWSCQKPARRAKQRDEAAIEHWRKVRWPQVKKGPDAAAR